MSAGTAEEADGGGFARLLHLLVPSVCAVCEAPRKDLGGSGVCVSCWSSLPLLDGGHGCPRCALPTAGGPCAACRAGTPIARAAALCSYEAGAAGVVAAFKFRGLDLLAEPIGARMASLARVRGLADADALVPIPSTRRRNRERGYDPAELLASAAARALGRPVRSLLSRARSTEPQSRLHAREREANVRGAFRASRRASGRALLLVDDVVTTGATARAAAAALRDAGASRVDLLAFARTPDPHDFRPEAS